MTSLTISRSQNLREKLVVGTKARQAQLLNEEDILSPILALLTR